MTTYTIALELTKEVQRVKRPVCVRINENETQILKAQLTRYFKPCTVECDKAQLHMLRDDGTWSHVDATCTGDSVECAIKAVQLGKTAQNACAYFFFQKGTQTETTESFQLRVERAAIDTEASDAFFDTTMNAIATKWGAYENAAEAQERARQSAESKRITAEQERVSAEQSRVTAEQERASAEQERASDEDERIDAENTRVSQENIRDKDEDIRNNAEDVRNENEDKRLIAEERRAQAETARQQNESTRVTAEQSRQSRFNEMLDAAQNVKFRILSASEVDSEGKPTITGSVGIIYLVKAQSAQETKANHYTEWIYLEGRWELFGSTAPTADPIEVDDIDKLAQGTTIAGNRVLNSTGLSALWSKLQARMQAVHSEAQAAQSTANAAKQASASNANSIQSLSSKQSTFEQQASNQLKALRTWAESTLESKMKERYNAGFKHGKQEGGDKVIKGDTSISFDSIYSLISNANVSDTYLLKMLFKSSSYYQSDDVMSAFIKRIDASGGRLSESATQYIADNMYEFKRVPLRKLQHLFIRCNAENGAAVTRVMKGLSDDNLLFSYDKVDEFHDPLLRNSEILTARCDDVKYDWITSFWVWTSQMFSHCVFITAKDIPGYNLVHWSDFKTEYDLIDNCAIYSVGGTPLPVSVYVEYPRNSFGDIDRYGKQIKRLYIDKDSTTKLSAAVFR